MKAELIRGDGGVFDVKVGETLIFSKHKARRHIRDNQEILDSIRTLQES